MHVFSRSFLPLRLNVVFDLSTHDSFILQDFPARMNQRDRASQALQMGALQL